MFLGSWFPDQKCCSLCGKTGNTFSGTFSIRAPSRKTVRIVLGHDCPRYPLSRPRISRHESIEGKSSGRSLATMRENPAFNCDQGGLLRIRLDFGMRKKKKHTLGLANPATCETRPLRSGATLHGHRRGRQSEVERGKLTSAASIWSRNHERGRGVPTWRARAVFTAWGFGYWHVVYVASSWAEVFRRRSCKKVTLWNFVCSSVVLPLRER